ncbi:MAG: hypothetical protein V3T72_21730 [Thermoanaerobaculia bacterium]
MQSNTVFLLSLTLSILGVSTVDARPLERVPQDGTLQQAINRVSNRGVIEIADGVYAPPAGGFKIDSPAKSFTIRAAAGATVVLDGQGTDPILVYEGTGAASGRRVSFERLVFRNGFSDQVTRGGGVTVAGGHAVFVSSVFEDNVNFETQSRGGGAVQITAGSFVNFTNCVFENNVARHFGGAVYVLDSKVNVAWSRFTGNRTNIPGHSPVASGGAMFVLDFEAPADTVVTINNTRFEGNEAAAVGGALNAFGVWRQPLSQPAARVEVINSTFVGNLAQPDVCCAGPTPLGGVAHVEDHVTLSIRTSRFEDNFATQGGAFSSYRARMEIEDSVFRGNAANLTIPGVVSAGGTFFLTSSDFSDPSTDFGTINRRNAELVMTDTLVQGQGDTPGFLARQGGCLLANGDLNRIDGVGGVPQDGSEADNRALVDLTDVVFADCDVESTAGKPGRGGAIFTLLTDLSAADSLFTGCDALGTGATGGALNIFDRSALRLTGTTFVHNSAEDFGGAVSVSGGEVEIDDCFFLENDVSPGVAETIQNASGAALTLSPDVGADRDITGVVEDSLFVANVGLPIHEIDRMAGPFNLVRYDGNEIHSTTFGTLVYKNSVLGAGGRTVPQLNSLTIPRTGPPPTDKSTRNNTRLTSIPRAGRLVAAPSRVLSTTAPGDPEPTADAFLGYAWSGNAATLDGGALADGSGVQAAATAGTYRLRVNNQNTASAAVGQSGCSDGRLMCLNQERFLIEVDWRDFNTDFGDALVAPVGSDDSGLSFFFDEDNWEILTKVLRGCGVNQRFWLFSAATTNVEYTLRITDTLTGLTKSYFNPLGSAAAAITDTDALAVCDAMAATDTEEETTAALVEELGALLRVAGPRAAGPREAAGARATRKIDFGALSKGVDCTPSGTNLCLNNGRFKAEVEWRDFAGVTGAGEVVPFGTNDSGLFFFFDEDNWEMLVKVLNGCGVTNHYWVFSAATTNVEYRLTVTDTLTGVTKEYFNPLDNAAPAIVDTLALPTCP